METITKARLAEIIAERAGITRNKAMEVVDTLTEEIIEALIRGEKVELRGFGSFRVRQRGPRTGRNPKTGESVEVPPKRIPYFKPGKLIREALLEDKGE